MRAPAAILLLALLATPAAAAGAPAPVLAPGDFWEREESGVRLREAVEAVETIEVAGAPVEALRLVESRDAGAGMEPVRTTWLRASDLAFLRARTPDGRVEEAAGPCASMAWPLEVGAEWVEDCAREARAAWHRRVASSGNVSTAAGVLLVYLVETRADNASGPLARRDWYAPDACGVVKTETYGATTLVRDLRTYRCAASPRPQPTTPPSLVLDSCGRFHKAACTPGPGAAEAALALALAGALGLAARRRAPPRRLF